jgi:protein-ribulosamine 3-kinase
MAIPFSTAVLAAVNAAAGNLIGHPFRVKSVQPATGGCINRSFVVGDGRECFFLKVNGAAALAQFAAEADGLNALRQANVRAPAPVAHGAAGDETYLLMEYMSMREPRTGDYVGLAEALATLHQSSASSFGWPQANFIGASHQVNPWTASWMDFWRNARLARQLELAAQNGHGGLLQSLGERLLAALPQVLGGHVPRPALVHGDLWHGNVGFLANGTPTLFDPAVYFGDREVDIAMSELFGGFPRVFYDAYFERLPVDEGYAARRDLYNVYHLLNHLNLFGGYRERVEILMRSVLTAVT